MYIIYISFSSYEKYLWSTIFKLIQSQNGRIMLNLVYLFLLKEQT